MVASDASYANWLIGPVFQVVGCLGEFTGSSLRLCCVVHGFLVLVEVIFGRGPSDTSSFIAEFKKSRFKSDIKPLILKNAGTLEKVLVSCA